MVVSGLFHCRYIIKVNIVSNLGYQSTLADEIANNICHLWWEKV